MGYQRAKHEEDIHYKQRSYTKFEKMFERYGLPLGQYDMNEKDQRVHDQALLAYEEMVEAETPKAIPARTNRQ